MYWTSSLSTGISSVDRQHKDFVEAINRTHELVEKDAGKNDVLASLRDIMQYATTHFEHEESLMRRFSYPEREDHAQKHRILAAQIELMTARCRGGEGVKPQEILEYLRTWLKDHLMETDQRYGDFLRSKGAA